MAINKEIWINEVQTNLFRGMEWVRQTFNADAYVNYKTVHIPNCGGQISVTRNRSQGAAATISQQTYNDVSFSLAEFTTNPVLITNLEELEISSTKLSEALKESLNALKQSCGDWMAYEFSPANTSGSTNGINTILRTSGSTRAASYPGTTGTRNRLCLADIQAARLTLNRMNCPQNDRHLLIDSSFYNDILTELGTTTYRDASRIIDLPNGACDRIMGFTIWERSTVGAASSGSSTSVTFRRPTDTIYTTDNAFALFWQAGCISSAIGEINVFEQSEAPEYYGSIISALMRIGAKCLRSDFVGVGAIVET
ncbi:MAG: phage capsid protein [Bacteroidota bacterium]